jgi:uncharacterized surface protein with fasciclin (FAS1) repeats
MKTKYIAGIILMSAALACSKPAEQTSVELTASIDEGQSAVQDDESEPNIVQTALKSPDHKTLVAALKAAAYVDALSNAGPFTVFAPTDHAFSLLPAGTVEDLIKPENKAKLQNILEYHVYVGVVRESMVHGSMTLNQVNGKNVSLVKEGDKLKVNGTDVVATVSTSNGIIYVIDQVLLPPQ